MSQLCRTLICGNPISSVVKAGRCVTDKDDAIKPKGTGSSCGELACHSVNESAYMILNEAQKTNLQTNENSSFSSHLDNLDSDFQELNPKIVVK